MLLSYKMDRCVIWIFLTLAGISLCEITNYKRVCYFTSWSIYDHYRKGNGRYTGSNVTDPSLCTHYIYSFVGFDVDNKTIIPLDEKRDEVGGYQELLNLKKKSPGIKVILGVGGYGFGVERFINLTQDEADIEEFCNNTVDYLRTRGFDGVDMDWSFPTQRGGSPRDRVGYVTLLQKLRSSFERESKLSGQPRLSLSSAVSISKTVVDQGYNRSAVGEAVDFLNMVTYDLSGGSDVLGHHAPLYPRADSQGEKRTHNVEWGMRYWAEEVPKEKLILGVPLYARTFSLYNSTLNNVGDIQTGSGTPGSYTQAPGVLSYYEVCKLIKAGVISEKWDEESSAPYAVSDTEFVTYDNQRSVKIKANFVKDNQYGGINVWELSYDDFGGKHCEAGNYPLLTALKQTLTQSRDDCPEGSYGELNSKGCTQCRRNFYQPKPNQLQCLSCPLGEISLSEGARGAHECILDCSSGSEFDYITRKCTPCNLGYYRVKPSSVSCVKCSSGFTTVSTGSTECVEMPEGYTSKPMHNVTLTYKIKMATETCDNVEILKDVVLESVKNTLNTASVRWSDICAENCSNIKLSEVSGCTGKKKESVMQDHILNFLVAIDNVPYEVFNGEIVRPTSSVISEILNRREVFSDLGSYKLGYDGVVSMLSRVVCPLPNHVVQNNECVPCEVGTYFNPITAECTVCGYGTYQDEVASDVCKSCPGILTTRSRGSVSLEHCVSRCELNPSYCRNKGECVTKDTIIRCKCKQGFEGKRCEKEPGEITHYKRVCYYGSWEIYKTGIYKFTADSIPDLDLCTHYIYSFAGVDPKNKTIIPLDEVDEKMGYKALTDKKKIKPDIKVILALGGWTFSALPAFTELVKTDESIDEFCENAVKYLRKWKFDGVDMDWEYPGNRGSPPQDKHNYATLMERLRRTFEREAEDTGKPRLLLSSAVPIGKDIVDSGFDRKRLGEASDFLNIMVYDLYTTFSDKVGHHTGLYPRADATGEDLQLNAEWGMGYWAEEIEKSKLILGLPTYSRTFTMNTTVNEPGDWDIGAGVAFSKVSVVRYYEICKKLQDGTWTEGWDDEQSVPFAFTDTEWSGYDNERSVQAKAEFVKDNQYGGLMVWQLPADDFSGTSCGKGKYPIIDAMRKSLQSSRDECRPGWFGHINRKVCSPCPKNTYQPGHKSTSCLDCPDGLITRSDKSTNLTDCISPCDLEPNYCSNGECRSTKTGLKCGCFEGFKGRFCDEPVVPVAEPQDSMQKLEVITSTFAAITCLLLLILVVMAIVLYKRFKGSRQDYEVKPNGFYQT